MFVRLLGLVVCVFARARHFAWMINRFGLRMIVCMLFPLYSVIDIVL
jgi:hypothetical protein